MKLKGFIITLFVLSNCFIHSKSELIDLSFIPFKSDKIYNVNEDSIKPSNYSSQTVSALINDKKYDLSFSEENNTSSTYFGTSVVIADINGDFYDDLILSETGAERVVIYFGGEETDIVPDLILHAEQEGSNFGITVSTPGDINNDGYNDLMIGASHYCDGYIDYHGRVYIYYGGVQMDNIPDLIFQGRIKNAFLGTDIAKLGDVNNDGCDDIGMCELNNDTCYIYFGGTDVDTIPDVLIHINDDTHIHKISGGGDFNNDSVSDILIGSPYYGEFEDYSDPMNPIYLAPYGRAYMFFGGDTLNSVADKIFEGKVRGDKIGTQLPFSNGDINNDSIDDILVGANDHVEVFYGGNNPDNIPDVSLPYISNGNDLNYVGDINNDSIGDIVLVSQENSMSEGYAYIYFGGEDFDEMPDKEIIFQALSEYWDISIFNGGDVNSDGHNDLIFTYRNDANGEVQVYFGGDLLDSIPNKIFTGIESGNNFGISISSAGDINNDGFNDLLVGASGYNFNTGKGYIYYGGFTMDTIPDLILDGEYYNENFGYKVDGLGDINNDNYDDFLIADKNIINVYFGDEIPQVLPGLQIEKSYTDFGYTGDLNNDGYDDIFAGDGDKVDLFFGGEDMDSIPDFNIAIKHNKLACAGDVNHDGYDDLLIGYPEYNSYTGRVYIYFGGNPFDDDVDLTLQGKNNYSYFGNYMSELGDVNNDGFDDFIIGATSNNHSNSEAYIFYGGNLMDNIPDVTLHETSDSINSYGIMLEKIGDVNGDTIDDVLVGAFIPGTGSGIYYIYNGGSVMDTIADQIYTTEGDDVIPSHSVTSLGDINKDSGNDLAFGSYTYPKNGIVQLYYGIPLISIGEQPLSQQSCVGDSITFSVVSTNTVNYSWEFSIDSGKTYVDLANNDDYSGSETSSLRVIAKTDIPGYGFRCRLSNDERFRYSVPAHLSIHTRPTSDFLGDSLYCMEDSVTLAIELTGSSPWIYTLSNGLDSSEYIVNETNHSFFVNDPGTYKVISLRDKYCPGIELGGDVNIYSLPTSLLYESGSHCSNDSVTLSIEFSGTSPWYYKLSNGSNLEELISYENHYTFNVSNPGTYSIISLQDKNCIGLNMSGVVEVEECSSLSSIENEEISIYPNPTDGKFTINKLSNNTYVQIISATGQTLLSQKVNTEMIEIDLSPYKPGICFLKIIVPGRIQIFKIIIE